MNSSALWDNTKCSWVWGSASMLVATPLFMNTPTTQRWTTILRVRGPGSPADDYKYCNWSVLSSFFVLFNTFLNVHCKWLQVWLSPPQVCSLWSPLSVRVKETASLWIKQGMTAHDHVWQILCCAGPISRGHLFFFFTIAELFLIHNRIFLNPTYWPLFRSLRRLSCKVNHAFYFL